MEHVIKTFQKLRRPWGYEKLCEKHEGDNWKTGNDNSWHPCFCIFTIKSANSVQLSIHPPSALFFSPPPFQPLGPWKLLSPWERKLEKRELERKSQRESEHEKNKNTNISNIPSWVFTEPTDNYDTFLHGWASVLFKRTEYSLGSFPFFIKERKERNDLCVLFHPL